MSTLVSGSRTAAMALMAVVALVMPAAALTTISNGIYDVHIGDSSGAYGDWNAVTGASHPVGAMHDLMYFDTTVTTNFSSLRVYRAAGAATYRLPNLGAPVSSGASSFGVNGFSQTWNVANENLSVTQDLVIAGSTMADSGIYHTVAIRNTGSTPTAIGWRNLYDWAVDDPGFDDGPSNSIETTVSVLVPTTTFEFTYAPVAAGTFARVAAAPPPGGGATYEPLLGLGFDPGFLPALPVTSPEAYVYASWPSSYGTDFDYAPAGNDVTRDSAGLSWFGRTASTAITIDAGHTVRFTQTIFGVPPEEPPPGAIPEPVTAALGGLGLAALALATSRRRHA